MKPLSLSPWTTALLLSSALFSHTVALRLLLLLLCVGLLLAAIANDRNSIRVLPPIWFVLALWAAWCGLSLAWSLEPERSIKELRNEIGYAVLTFWVCYASAQAHNAARAILPVLAAAAVLVCVIALYYFSQGLPRYYEAWHGGPGNLSSALLTMMPCVLMGAWYAERAGSVRVSVLSLALTALFLLAAYTTFNRTVWFGFAGQLVLMGALLVSRGEIRIAPHTKMVAAVLAIVAIAGAALMTSRIQAERGENSAAIALSQDMRVKLWPEVVEHIKERPLTGYGFGRGLLRKSLSNESHQSLLWHAHNLLLDTILQVGLPGLLLLLLLLGVTLREGLRMARSPDDLAAACGLAVIGVVLGMVIRNMTDTLWVRQNALLYWGVLGVLFAWGHRPRVAASP